MKKNIFLILSIFSITIVLFFSKFHEFNMNKISKFNLINEKKVTDLDNVKFFQRNSTSLNANTNIVKIKEFYNNLSNSEMKIYSQYKEDGVIIKLMGLVNKTQKGFYVEFGTENGNECNSRNLREKFNWTGLLMDSLHENLTVNLHKETITHSNILDLFVKYNVTDNIDLLSEDTDYADYWILEKILTKYHPKVVVHEVNQQLPEFCVTVPKPDLLIYWEERSTFHGGNVCAFFCLAKRFNYTMVYCNGINCFWIRNDILFSILNIEISIIQKVLNPTFLYKFVHLNYLKSPKKWHQVAC